MHSFFQKEKDESMVVRRSQRQIIQFPGSQVQYQLLSPHLRGKIEFLMVELMPGRAT